MHPFDSLLTILTVYRIGGITVILEMCRMHRKFGRYQKQVLGITGEILEKLIQTTEAGNRGAETEPYF